MDINNLATSIRQQADRLFPNRTDSSMFLKTYGELAELISAKTPEARASELADLFIMLLDYGSRHNIDIRNAIIVKSSINDQRTWEANELGVFQHVKE